MSYDCSHYNEHTMNNEHVSCIFLHNINEHMIMNNEHIMNNLHTMIYIYTYFEQ